MLKLNPIIKILIYCFLGSLTTACTANTSPTPTATPAPTSTPLSTPTEPPPTATTESPAEASLITTTGAFFALSVADVNASAQWYSDKLGLKIVLQPPKTNQTTVIVLEGGGLIVELLQRDGAQPLSAVAPTLTDRTLVYGITKVGIIVDDFDKTVAILTERNVSIAFGPFPATADQRANVIIQDNEGNLIQFFGK